LAGFLFLHEAKILDFANKYNSAMSLLI